MRVLKKKKGTDTVYDVKKCLHVFQVVKILHMAS